LPERPVGAAARARPRRPARAQENPAQRDQGARRPPGAAAAAAPSGPTIQLGAYASTIKADTAWKMLSAASRGRRAAQVGGRDRRRRAIYPAARGRLIRQTGRPARAEGRRRKLLRGQLMQAAIYGSAGPELTPTSALLSATPSRPAIILFRRNCETQEQLRG
jgi:hypothetical protein